MSADTSLIMRSGRLFDYEDMLGHEFDIEDIAHALSNICRHGGHHTKFYSVAQHSFYVSHLLPTEHALAGLIHDAHEAFIGDMPSPLKKLIPGYMEIEEALEKSLLAQFGVSHPLDPCVKQADLVMLAAERRDLLATHNEEWAILKGVEAPQFTIEPWSPDRAKRVFLNQYRYLTT